MTPNLRAFLPLAALRGEGFGIEDGQATSAADGAALVMLGVVFFVVGLIGVFAWTMKRRAHRPDPTLEFLSQLRDEAKETGPGDAPAGAAESWERPADWWKQG
jgi:hypothetical protein